MKVYHHWLSASIQSITHEDIETLASLLDVGMYEFNVVESRTGTTYYNLSLSGSKDAVHITLPTKATYSTVTLKGKYFDTYPSFDVGAFRDFIYQRSGNILQQDITYEDDTGDLDFNELRNMCSLENYQRYMTGSSVADRKKLKADKPDSCNRSGIPDPHSNFELIHFGNLDSNYCAKSYVMMNGNIKFELSVNDKKLNKALLDAYDQRYPETFNELAKQALVKCVDFITPSSKRAKRPKQVDSWRRFLGSEIKPIRWKDHIEVTKLSKEDSFYSAIHKQFGSLRNLLKRFDIAEQTQAILETAADGLLNVFEASMYLETG